MQQVGATDVDVGRSRDLAMNTTSRKRRSVGVLLFSVSLFPFPLLLCCWYGTYLPYGRYLWYGMIRYCILDTYVNSHQTKKVTSNIYHYHHIIYLGIDRNRKSPPAIAICNDNDVTPLRWGERHHATPYTNLDTLHILPLRCLLRIDLSSEICKTCETRCGIERMVP